MLYNKLLNEIPEVHIKSFKDQSSGFLITDLNELNEKHSINSPHRISYYQIILFAEGDGSIVIDTRKYQYGPRSLLAVPKGRVEISKFTKDSNGYAILFSEEFLNKNSEDINWINSLKLFDLSMEPLVRNLTDQEYIELLIYLKKLMTESMAKDDFAKEDIIINLLKTFILISERIKRKRVCNEPKDITNWYYIIKFKKKLEENFCNAKSVGQYAELLNITIKKLNKVTKAFWGKPAKNIIEERVLLETKRLLIHTDKSIKEISILLGFNEPTNFNKYFKKYTGETPAQFRAINKDRIVP